MFIISLQVSYVIKLLFHSNQLLSLQYSSAWRYYSSIFTRTYSSYLNVIIPLFSTCLLLYLKVIIPLRVDNRRTFLSLHHDVIIPSDYSRCLLLYLYVIIPPQETCRQPANVLIPPIIETYLMQKFSQNHSISNENFIFKLAKNSKLST